MDNKREVAQSYGPAFDDLVSMVADAMMASGYRSRHASPQKKGKPTGLVLADTVTHLGFFLAKLETALVGPLRSSHSEFAGEGFLSIYAAAKRLLVLYRYAQSNDLMKSRAAAEVDGEIDVLEDAVLRPESPEALIEASNWIVSTSVQFQDGLPEAVLEQVMELRDLLEKMNSK